MNLFETSGSDYINLDQVTRFERGADYVTLHFDSSDRFTLRREDAAKLLALLAQSAAELPRRGA